MAVLYPAATWLPISRNFTPRVRARTRGVILHVDAGNARSLRGWFNQAAAGGSSHLHFQRDGGVEQYVDLDHIAWTSRDGSVTTIGVETQGFGSGSWTAEQCEEIAKFLAWASARYGFPLRLMASSQSGEQGVGWHRLGIDGDFPSGQLGGRRQRGGGESWSVATGKECPGDERIRQIPRIVERAKQIMHGTSTTTTGQVVELSHLAHACFRLRFNPAAGWPPAADRELTEGDIQAWQKVMGTTVDGVVSDPSGLVRKVQAFLSRWPWADLEPDGLYGPRTRAAVEDYLLNKNGTFNGAATWKG